MAPHKCRLLILTGWREKGCGLPTLMLLLQPVQSRYGLLTGIYPWRKDNTRIVPGNSGLLIDTATVTVGDVFQRAGYTTGVNCIIPLQTLLKTMWSVNTPMWLKSYLLYWIPFVQSIKIKM